MSRNGGQSLLKFMYNADGIRTNKIVDGVNHVYTLNGTQIVSEAWGTNLLIYLYDESGAPIGMQYRTNSYAANVFDTFYFEMNLQGDIVAVYNADCDKIGSYNYDAWGNFTVTVESTNTTLENRIVRIFNPFRYRGYYYDADTGLYYLQSRYYNPQWGRFLNADGYVSTGTGLLGYNMYAYCNNNPVMCVDPNGNSALFAFFLISVGIGMLLGAILLPTPVEIESAAEEHYARNEKNQVNESIDSIKENYTKVEEWADKYHENVDGLQGEEAVYNDKYLSPNGGHIEVIICNRPNGDPYIVDQFVDPINMGTYNYASNEVFTPLYYADHFIRDMLPYYAFGNTRSDDVGFLKWLLGSS